MFHCALYFKESASFFFLNLNLSRNRPVFHSAAIRPTQETREETRDKRERETESERETQRREKRPKKVPGVFHFVGLDEI